MTQPFQIVFALFPGLTQLDFTAPLEVLQRLPGARVTLASSAGGRLATSSALILTELATLSSLSECDLLCVPGGYDLSPALRDTEYLAQLRRLAAGARYLTSVCTGSLLLLAAGLLEGKRAACHWGWRELLAEGGAIPDPGRVVRDGNVITGGGVTAGLDFGLAIAAEVAGADVARAIQLSLEYDPQPPFDAGSPERAPSELVARVRERAAQTFSELRSALAARPRRAAPAA
jgi:transcriptional regulator GlxA family with amidase domain